MKSIFHARLINDPFYDPVLFIRFLYKNRVILFDLGDISSLPAKEILKISHVFVSHTHMDHFIGFDILLRILLGREKKLYIYGPKDFLKNIEGKLSGYTWNLVSEYVTDFRIIATEIQKDKIIKKEYPCNKKFIPLRETYSYFNEIIIKEPNFYIKTVILDHKIPCLGFSLIENFHVNINKQKLKELDLPVGPWLNRFKNEIYKDKNSDREFCVTWEEKGMVTKKEKISFQKLLKEIAIISPGQKITYITDIVGNEQNINKVVEFAKNSDILFIESTFLDKDKELAIKKSHLTAKQAGMIARMAKAKKIVVFHFSPRYYENPDELKKEAMAEFNK